MSALPLAKPVTDLTRDPSYLKLRKDTRAILAKGRSRAEAVLKNELALTYWELGRRINRDLLRNENRAGYNQKVFSTLSEDLRIGKSLLYDASKLARLNPNFPPEGNLTWSPLRRVLAVQDSTLRTQLAQQARQNNWGKIKVESEIKKIRRKNPARRVSRRPAPSFKPRRGVLNIYRAAYPTKNSKTLELDLGFYTFRALTPKQAAKYQEGTIVETRQDAGLHASRAAKNALYTYTAELERVVDGDTLWMKIRLGFGISTSRKLRLRGIDCPELGTRAGLAAKKFAEKILAPHASFVVTTTKPDKYDRYLSDIWIGDLNLNQQLLENNFARLKTSYRSSDWEK